MLPEKYYIEFAKIFNKNKVPKGSRTWEGYNVRQSIIDDFSKYLRTDNVYFNEDKFIEACNK